MPEVIPAIDLRSGKCVRLAQGRRDREVSYGDDPLEIARRWAGEGARRLHVVDLDGAFEGRLTQGRAIESIARRCGLPIQVGGGLRSERDVEEALGAGADRVILGTAALENEAFLTRAIERWGEKVAVAIDVRDGQPVMKGWEEAGQGTLADLLKRLRQTGVRRVVVTDVERDGMLDGPNLILVASVARLFGGAVIASGGFTSKADFVRVRRLGMLGVEGVVVGKALYEGRVTLREAIEALAGEPGAGSGGR